MTSTTIAPSCRRCSQRQRERRLMGKQSSKNGLLGVWTWSQWQMRVFLFALIHANLWGSSHRSHCHFLAASAFQPAVPVPFHARTKQKQHASTISPTRGDEVCILSLSNNGHRRRRLGSSHPLLRPVLSSLASTEKGKQESDEYRPLHDFQQLLSDRNVDDAVSQRICHLLHDSGFPSTSDLVQFAADFEQSKSPESLSRILQSDFGFSAYLSHICRAALFDLARRHRESPKTDNDQKTNDSIDRTDSGTESPSLSDLVAGSSPSDGNDEGASSPLPNKNKSGSKANDVGYWDFVVNAKQQERLSKADYRYALPKHYERIFPTIALEIEEEFLAFMTQPTASSQEPPIREATAVVYQRHARQFAGWFLKYGESTEELDMGAIRSATSLGEKERENDTASLQQCKAFSIHSIISSKNATSAQPILEYVVWLRKVRNISNGYEANLLRGLTKMLKYRFASESVADPTYGEKSFHDIPVVRELRRLQRDANRRQVKSSERSSDEKRKWLSWKEYLKVVETLKNDVADELEKLVRDREDGKTAGGLPPNDVGRRIAKKYQRYLLLAFFSSLPDRQRTMRELEVGRTFLRNDETNTWAVKHGFQDYKTGNTYGDRPPLGLSPALTSSIDDYWKYWRPYLKPSSDHFFVGPNTGKPFTVEGIRYQVGKACYDQTGKKTNPHLLRDMIVTHVRDSADVSERDLEALALFMGHSVSMQRSSYDRRTLDQKVAPAVELLQNINSRM